MNVAYLRGFEPFVFCSEVVHRTIEVVQVFVSQEVVVDDVPLATSMFERVSITLAREVEPL